MAVNYEWATEYKLDSGDIEEVVHWDAAAEAILDHHQNKEVTDLVLVRDLWRDEDLDDRQWAYVENGKLPKEFDGGAKVPQRFHKALAKHQ